MFLEVLSFGLWSSTQLSRHPSWEEITAQPQKMMTQSITQNPFISENRKRGGKLEQWSKFVAKTAQIPIGASPCPVPSPGETSSQHPQLTQAPAPKAPPSRNPSPLYPPCPQPVPSALLSGQVPPAPPLLPATPSLEATLLPPLRQQALRTSRPLRSSASMEPMRVLWYDSQDINWHFHDDGRMETRPMGGDSWANILS